MARKLTIKELKKIIEAEKKKPQRPEEVEVKQRPWWDVDGAMENQVDWMKALKIKEMFAKRLGKK